MRHHVDMEWHAVIDMYAEHLRHERGRSEHTIRAYIGDLRRLAEVASDGGVVDPSHLTVTVLRHWLAKEREAASDKTVARRVAAVRNFTAWAQRKGYMTEDPGVLLASPKVSRTLPHVLRQNQAAQLLDLAATAADDESAERIRDLAILELLYGTGIRVGECAGLDLTDVDVRGQTIRVMGKGRKERIVPFGGPARDAEFEKAMAGIAVPVLALFGTRSTVVSTDAARLYSTLLPKCFTTMVYDAGHDLDLDRPDAVTAVVKNFLQHGETFIVNRDNAIINP